MTTTTSATDGLAEESLRGTKMEEALAHLQPIRDLAKNWDIDIAHFLEDCLEELIGDFEGSDEIQLGNNSDGPPPNFTQAALLLQNSSHVYSRKVEYLHSLVYTALNELISSSGQKQKKSNRTGTLDASVEEFLDFDPNSEFLLLDDVLPTDNSVGGNKINLSEEEMGFADTSPLTYLPDGHTNDTTTRLSLGGLSVTRLDRSSLASTLGDHTTPANRAALMGSILNDGSDTGGGNLRLLSGRCDLNENGVLLLPGAGLVGSTKARTSLPDADDNDASFADNTGVDHQDDDPLPFDNDNDGDDHENDGAGFDFAAGDDATEHVESMDEGSTTVRLAGGRRNAPEPERPDPWKLLDPHDPGTSKPRPIRIGTTYRLPEGFDEPPSQSVTGASTKRRANLSSVYQQQPRNLPERICIASQTFESVMAHRRRVAAGIDGEKDDRDSPVVPLKGLVFGEEFAYIAKAQAKRKATERRERRKLLATNPESVPTHEADALLGLDDNAGLGDMDDDFGGDDNDHDFGGFDDDGGDVVGNAGISNIDAAFSSVPDGDGLDNSNVDVETFEALCRAHIQAFVKGAEKYAAETNLSKRVGSWQQRLAPILEEEEQRPVFDIQKYGNQIIVDMEQEISKAKLQGKLSSSQQDANTVDFRTITKNCEQYEVCRIFVVSLMLSNSGNVVLDHDGDADQLRLELVNSSVDSPMETYLAPSAMEEAAVAS